MRVAGVVTVAVIAVAGLVGTTPAAGQEPAPPLAVSWQSAGDSFSSGEGVFGNEGACAQSDQAYGPAVADLLRSSGWQITSETFTACTGHLVEDYFNPRADSGAKAALWDWGQQQGGPARVDVITMSFGGNDVGFADVLTQCLLVVPDSWGEFISGGLASGGTFIAGGLASSLTGCDESEAELRARADALLDPPRRDCTGTRRSGDAGFDCDLDLGDRRGSIIDFYYDIVTRRLTDRGRLYIVGYPRLFADANQWPGWAKIACQGVKRGDTEKLGDLAEHLNNKLKEAVERVNQSLGADRVVFVDRFASYRDGLHELCGTDEDWLNGIAVDRGDGFGLRKETSFHPNAAGHTATAAEMDDIVQRTFPRQAQLQLSGDGVGPSPFGTPTEAASSSLTGMLGEPDEDSGWRRFLATDELSDSEFAEAGRFYAEDDALGDAWRYQFHRRLCWSALCVHFGGNSESGGQLRGWELGVAGGRSPDPSQPDAQLAGTGIRLGSTWAEVQTAYPGVVAGGAEGGSLAVDDRPWDGIFDGVAQWRLSGSWDFERPTFAPEDAQVTRLSGGEGPEPGCC